MSWSLSLTLENDATQAGLQAMINAVNAASPSGNDQCVKERDEQVQAAKLAACGIIGEVMGNAEEISVSLSGHANKDHKNEGANEHTSVNVYVKKYKEPAVPS